ncbi:MAG: STAS-like domain-containing protein [Syntrophobacteraceae bacterium]
MKIDIQKVCDKKMVTREDGQVINQILTEHWAKTRRFEIDFGNLLVASVSFIDEAFGKFALCHTGEDLKQKLVFENMVEYDRQLLNDVINSRLRQQNLETKNACREDRKNGMA